jgi:hypothetical protein
VSWYEDLGPVDTAAQTHEFSVWGSRSLGEPLRFDRLVSVGAKWAPCPGAGTNNYGDQISDLIFPDLPAAGSIPAIISVYASSIGGCNPQRAFPLSTTFDQHVESYRWPQ